jgi:hypothetical protein
VQIPAQRDVEQAERIARCPFCATLGQTKRDQRPLTDFVCHTLELRLTRFRARRHVQGFRAQESAQLGLIRRERHANATQLGHGHARIRCVANALAAVLQLASQELSRGGLGGDARGARGERERQVDFATGKPGPCTLDQPVCALLRSAGRSRGQLVQSLGQSLRAAAPPLDLDRQFQQPR